MTQYLISRKEDRCVTHDCIKDGCHLCYLDRINAAERAARRAAFEECQCIAHERGCESDRMGEDTDALSACNDISKRIRARLAEIEKGGA